VNQFSAGRTAKKYTKYSAVNSLLATTKGASAALIPRNIKVKKIAKKNQTQILWRSEYTQEIIRASKEVLRVSAGIAKLTRIAANIPIAPPNLLGHARRIA